MKRTATWWMLVTATVVALTTAGGNAVVGGQPADPGEYPWMAAVYAGSSPTGQYCGGSLVAPDVVVTAAHCVSELIDGTLAGLPVDVLGQKVKVMIGNTSLSSGGGERIVVRSVHEYPGGGPSRGDVAVLALQSASTYPPLAIARPGDEAFFDTGVMSTVLGWGATSEGGGGTNTLREAQVPIVSDADCSVAYSSMNPALEICAGYPEGGVDTCQGDSGGPLVVPGSGGEWLLAGVTSWGDGCARPGKPGVYAEVAAVSSFIDQYA